MGFYLSGHPLDRYVDDAKKLGAIPTGDLVHQRHNAEAAIVGIVAGLKERLMKSGDGRWAVLTLEDTFGQAEVLVFSRVYEEAEPILKSGEPVLIRGRALIDDINDEGQQLVPKMRAEEVKALAEAQIERTRWVEVHVEVPAKRPGQPVPERFDPTRKEARALDEADLEEAERCLKAIESLCRAHPGDKPTRVHLTMPAGYQVVVGASEELKVHPAEDLLVELERIGGVAQVLRC